MPRLIPGAAVVWKDREWILLDIPDIERVLLRDPASGRTDLALVHEVRLAYRTATGRQGLAAVPKDDWNQAWARFKAIRPLLGRPGRSRTTAEVQQIAAAFGKDRATVYRWIKKGEAGGTASSLLRSRRSDAGKSRLADSVETIIRQQIECFYLVKERPSPAELLEQIEIACLEAQLPVPDYSTVRRRLAQLPGKLVMAKRHSPKEARYAFDPLRGSFPDPEVPLAVYQIDHTPIDVCFVDEQHRLPIGRGYLTIVVDCRTRMVAGFCVSFDPPGALSTGLALTHAILPKAPWLAEIGVDASWPIHGIPARILADNAKEFRGTMIERACNEYAIETSNRPKGMPHYGGYVERLFRTLMKRTHSLPGSTFSNVEERGEYDSEGRAVMTLNEYTRWLTIFITKVYHQRRHSSIGMAPIKLYEQLIVGGPESKGVGLPEPVADEFKLRLDFMPYIERTVQEYGVLLDYIYYYADVLRPWIHARDPNNPKLKRKFIFARDPRDIGELYFFDPEARTYFPIPYRDRTHPRMSVWELTAILDRLAKHPDRQINEKLIFEGLSEMRQIQRDASEKTRKVRREQQRREGWTKAAASRALKSPPVTSESEPGWADSVQPFDDIEEAQ